MTTIACNRDMMAGDSRSSDGEIMGRCSKVFRVGGDILGFAGSLSGGLQFVRWYRDQDKDKPDITDTEILILKSDGTIEHWDSGYIPMTIAPHPFYSIGSGAHIALGAMYAGATPKEATAIACKLDAGSGGPVKVLKRKGA